MIIINSGATTTFKNNLVSISNREVGIVTSGSVFLALASNVASYPGTGNFWYDISGNQNTGSLINVTYNGSSSLVFDGNTSNIEFNSGSAINNLSGSTFSMWLNWTETLATVDTTFLYKSNDNANAGWFIAVSSTYGGIGMDVVKTSNKRYYLPASETPPRNTWYMLTVTWNGDSVSTGGIDIYINGVKNNTTPQTNTAGSGTHFSDAGQILDIGNARPGTNFHFGGDIGFVQIHNRVLSQSEITQNYNATKATYGI